MLRTLIAIALLTPFTAGSAAAEPCQGFLNAMEALEAKMKDHQTRTEKPLKSNSSQTRSISQSLDELEKLVQKAPQRQTRLKQSR